MYDLDKTQEWLNRTIQLNSGPAVRGGVSSEPHARKHTAVSVLVAFVVIAVGMLLISWTRGAGGTDANIVSAEGSSRVAPAPPRMAPAFATAPPAIRAAPARPRPAAGWPALSLDGDIKPLPGHTAPPAPIWLDGAIMRR
jgi:hypothetical protein